MAYTNFTFEDLEDQFGISFKTKPLFSTKLKSVKPSNHLVETIKRAATLNIRIEKPRSEFLIAPIMAEIKIRNDDRIDMFSGENLLANPKLGLNGEVDFILTNVPHSPLIKAPIIAVIEAKKADLELNQPQCAAQIVGTKVFNENANKPLDTYFGCVTTGREWQFLQLLDNTIYIDQRVYLLSDLPVLLGVFQHIIELY
jgi:hypothetical protein